MRQGLLRAACAAVLCGSIVSTTRADVSGNWLLTGSGSFNDGNNWTPAVPNAGTASFTGNSGGTVNGVGSIGLTAFVFDSNTRTLLSGGQYNLATGILDSRHVNADSTSSANFASLAPNIAATLSGFGGLVKEGSGAVLLSVANDFVGTVYVNAGTLQIASDASLGNVNNSLVLNGGALQNASLATATINRPFSLGGGTSTLNGAMTLGGVISGGGNLRFSGNAQTLTAANTYGGTTVITGGTNIVGSGAFGVTLSGNGALRNSNILNVIGSQLTLSNTTTAVANRILDNSTLFLRAGTLSFVGNATTNLNETVGSGTIDSGGNVLAITNVNTTAAGLTFTSFVRGPHATLAVQAPTLNRLTAPGSSLTIANAASLLIGPSGSAGSVFLPILPFAVESSTFSNQQLLTASTSGSVRPLVANEYETNINTPAASSNVRLAADATLSASASVNALVINANTLSGSSTLNVNAGLIAGAGTVSCPVNFYSREGVIFSTHVTGPISGTGGVTYDMLGGGVPVFTPNSVNPYTGQTTINGGTAIFSTNVSSGAPGPFGADIFPVVLSGGATPAALLSTSASTFGRGITVDVPLDTPAARAPALLGNFTVTGTITLNGPLRVNNLMNLYGKITGPGALLDTFGQSNVVILGGNDYTGGTVLRSGTLNFGSNTALGTGTLTLSGGNTLNALNGSKFLQNPIFFDPNGFAASTLSFATTSAPITMVGPVDLGADSAVRIIVPIPSVSMAGTFSNGGIVKEGTGTLNIGAFHLSNLTINNGAVRMPANTAQASRTAALSIASTSKLLIGSAGLVVTYADGASPINTLRGYLAAGSLASATTSLTAVGYADNTELGLSSFSNLAVPLRSVLLKPTYFGDANLDGAVDVSDLGLLASHWQQNGLWTAGDFDYSGFVDVSDLGLLASNWQKGVAAGGVSFAQALAATGLGASVPEPTTLTLAALALATLRRRRTA